MKPPIIIIESWDISVHPSVDHVEKFLEIVDIREGIYTAYDSEGYLLDLSVGQVNIERHFLCFKWIASFESAILRDTHPRRERSGELREKLLNSLTHRGIPQEKIQAATLLELIYRMGKYMPWKIV